jgi:hypothetical protein
VGPRIVSAVTSQWLRVDLILAEATGDRCTLHGDHVVVFDNLGVEFGPPPALRLDPVGLTAQISRFMRTVGLVVRDLHRGDFRLCCFAVEFLVDELVTLMYQSQGLARGGKKGAYEHLPDPMSTCSEPCPSPYRTASRSLMPAWPSRRHTSLGRGSW